MSQKDQEIPEVTIVIPMFKPNVGFLKDLFNSIVNQDFKEFNIVITDDHSDKNLIFDNLPFELLNKTEYIQNVGAHGIFGNLNNGLRNAHGKYIQIFCQDDLMLPSFISSNYSNLKNNREIGLVFTSFNFINNLGEYIKFDRKDITYIPSMLMAGKCNGYFLYFGCIPGNLSSVMIDRRVFEKLGYFEETYKYAGDFEFWVRASQSTNILFTREALLLVRDHQNRASRVLSTLMRYNEIKNVYSFLIKNIDIPIPPKTLVRYIHIYIFRSIVSFLLRRNINLKSSEVKEVFDIFNGNPYTFRIAFLSFFYPFPTDVQKLKEYMEIIHE